MLRTLRSQVFICIFGIVIVSVGVVSIVTSERLDTILQRDARRLVSLTAETRQTMLIRALKLNQEQAKSILNKIKNTCEIQNKLKKRCTVDLLENFIGSDLARAALLNYKGSFIFVGDKKRFPRENEPADEHQLAIFRTNDTGKSYYLVNAKASEDTSITLYYNFDGLTRIFENPSELGEKGETFLIGPSGQYITPFRSDSSLNQATYTCLSGKSGSMTSPDYQGVEAIQAYRYLPEIGGGCIKAIIAESQVLAPLRTMKHEIWGLILLLIPFVGVFSFLLSNRVLSPISILAKRVVAFEQGDLDSPVPMQGPSEIQRFARVFVSMADALRRMIRDREEWLSIVSHDLKNPIANIQLNIGMIERRLAGGEVPTESKVQILGHSKKVFDSCRKMRDFISDLLDLAKIESGFLTIDRKRELVGSIMSETSEFFQNLALEKLISLRIEPLPEQAAVMCDRSRVFQVMSNLVGNALKFTPERGEILIGCECTKKEAVFYVKDSGPGIPDAAISHLFDRFWQAKQAERKGHGLGLYICQRIILAHGGRIWVESVLGQGATFRFSIPQVNQSGYSGIHEKTTRF